MHSTTDYSHAEKLRQELAKPLFNVMLKKWVGTGELDYEVYLKTGTLLSLQSRDEELVTHDELMFQIVHQSQELWLKLASREMVEVVADLDRDEMWGVSSRLERVARIIRGITSEMAVLETMTPDTYQTIRRSLGNGSGQESPGYNTLRLAAAGMEDALERLLARRERTLLSVYSAGGMDDAKHVCERLVDVDEAFQGWLYAHFQLVRRTIGVDRTVKALDGLPSQVLAARMTLPLFRKLWDVRVEMTNAWKREGGYAPGAQREGGGCPAAYGAYDTPKPQATPVMQASAAPSEETIARAKAAGCPMHAGATAHTGATVMHADGTAHAGGAAMHASGTAAHADSTTANREETIARAKAAGCPMHAGTTTAHTDAPAMHAGSTAHAGEAAPANSTAHEGDTAQAGTPAHTDAPAMHASTSLYTSAPAPTAEPTAGTGPTALSAMHAASNALQAASAMIMHAASAMVQREEANARAQAGGGRGPAHGATPTVQTSFSAAHADTVAAHAGSTVLHPGSAALQALNGAAHALSMAAQAVSTAAGATLAEDAAAAASPSAQPVTAHREAQDEVAGYQGYTGTHRPSDTGRGGMMASAGGCPAHAPGYVAGPRREQS